MSTSTRKGIEPALVALCLFGCRTEHTETVRAWPYVASRKIDKRENLAKGALETNSSSSADQVNPTNRIRPTKVGSAGLLLRSNQLSLGNLRLGLSK